MKEAQEVLKKIQETPEAGASGPVLESAASEAERSKAHLSAKVTQIPDPPIYISPSHHPQLILTKTTYLLVRNSTFLNLNRLS